MNKLLLSGVGALALIAVAGTSAHAWSIMSPTTNTATVTNTVEVEANSGDNDQDTSGRSRSGGMLTSGNSSVRGRNTMTTGNTVAVSTVQNEVNNGCACEDDWSIMSPETNTASVTNDVEVEAESGDNDQTTRGRSRSGGTLSSGESSVRGRNTMRTGDARADSDVWNVVNASVMMPL